MMPAQPARPAPSLVATDDALVRDSGGRAPGSLDDHPLDDRKAIDAIRHRLEGVLKGKPGVIRDVLVGLLSHGHVLLEDRPGLGKTTLAKALATAIGGGFARVQCTPDLLPSDITGFNIYNQRTQEFDFRAGPVFADILLADEINRATPRTQSALLEAMAERQVTVDTRRFPLSAQFFVIATQNPHEQHGTYPLPEAQLDRFALKLEIGYPPHDDERAMLAAAVSPPEGRPPEATAPVLQHGQLARIQSAVAAVAGAGGVQAYLVRLAERSRAHPQIHLGVSPRGLVIWQRAAQAWAWLDGRDFVTPEDVTRVALPVLSVRLGVDRADAGAVIESLLETVAVPAAADGFAT
ncbi:MAG: AAA family ATPase [Planctomycetaceae bacterium]